MEFVVIIIFLAGLIIGGIAVYFFVKQRLQMVDNTREQMKDVFATLSVDALNTSTDQFLKLASETLKGQTEKGVSSLEEKKKLIDANLKQMSEVLEGLSKESVVLRTQLSESQKETEKLRGTAEDLRNVLSSSQARGQWGERMVEDILKVIGLVENVNYVKQTKISSGEKPDFTFFLPKEKKVNMDVKFPLAHYERFITADIDDIKEKEKKLFLDDVKGHIKTVADRGYINPTEGTVDYVLMFIPNESIYSFIHQSEPDLLDLALGKHIVLCSPITLYAVLSLIHQAVGNFAMEEKAGEIMALLREFEKQWNKFVESMEKMGRRIDDAKREFESLTTTRTRQLERPLQKIKEVEIGILPERSSEKD
ncbi:MAG: DNA recombination protein RmuC [Candidatus Marinimicrobia bacterium]|nr:DNA recombination protein RmuC [Candidatus Neomarinimicrobiota bacterium]